MRVYFDQFSGDEVLSDSYPIAELHNGVIFEVQSTLVVPGATEIDIGRGNAFGGGGEEQKVQDDPNVERVNDILDAFKLQEVGFSKKDYVNTTKVYMQRLRKFLNENKPDREQIFMQGASAFVKEVVSNFGEYKFYTGEGYDTSAMIILERYKNPEDVAPVFLYIRDGLDERKY